MKITKEEVLRLAEISKIHIEESEIESIITQLEAVLSYAQCVQEVVGEMEEQPSNRNINFFREDVVMQENSQDVLARAPEREEDFFVVPSILEK